MCFFARTPTPTPPPLPKPEPKDSPIESPIEPVASNVAVGDQRKQANPIIGDNRTTNTSKEKKSKSGTKVTGGKIARAIAPKRLGTRSLQIPLLPNSKKSGNLNY